MIIVTGAAGFIGSNLIRKLNELGERDILAVDSLHNGKKIRNLVGLELSDYLEKDAFLELLEKDQLNDVSVVFHQGACSDTTEWDGRYLMQNNYEYSKSLFAFCSRASVPMIYASSASVYGLKGHGSETDSGLQPLNPYAYSKMLFDNYVARQPSPDSQVVGLRYFNVYGPGEDHKGRMASVIFHFYRQLMEGATCRLFGEYDGYAAGTQERDFVYVDDIADINIWMWKHPEISGVFNCGTGVPTQFRQMAEALIAEIGRGEIEFIDFPDSLKGAYQSYTRADITALRDVGYDRPFTSYREGVQRYVARLAAGTDD